MHSEMTKIPLKTKNLNLELKGFFLSFYNVCLYKVRSGTIWYLTKKNQEKACVTHLEAPTHFERRVRHLLPSKNAFL